MKRIYLALCIVGLVLPFSFFVPWILEHGLDLQLLVSELFSTRIGAFFGTDVLVAAVALFVLILTDGRKNGVRPLWLPVVGTLCVGVSFGLPLYLYLRERALDQYGQPSTGQS